MPVGSSTRSKLPNAVEALPVQPGRRRPRGGQPVQHHVVEHLVAGQHVLADRRRSRSTTRTSRRSTPAGRRANPPTRSRRSAAASTAAWSSPSPTSGSTARARAPASRSSVGFSSLPGGKPSGMFRWIAHAAAAVAADLRGDRCAPVATLRAEALVAEPAHQGVPRRRDLARRPSPCRWACRRSRIPAATGTPRRTRARSAAR